MTTWATLTTNVLRSLDDPNGIFHTEVLSYLTEGELLLVLARVIDEKTFPYPLTGKTIYPLHTLIPDLLTVLRVSHGGNVLPMDHLATINLTDPDWQQQRQPPESWFPVGATHFGLHPTPLDGEVSITYLAAPPAVVGGPVVEGASPTVQVQWHTLLEDYSRAIALAKESQFQRAVGLLKQTAAMMGIRDVRFIPTDRQSPEAEGTVAAVKPTD